MLIIPSRTRKSAFVLTLSFIAAALTLIACTEPPSWQKLLASKIRQQYPAYKVLPLDSGNLSVERPGMSTMPVDVNAIAAFCLRGTKDCDYAADQMLLQLQKP
ncbi:MAG: hypothetical protein V4718_00425 [Pseudomonadota bacterium]